MSTSIQEAGATRYGALGGIVVLITAASVEQTGLIPGAFYEFVAIGGGALCRWDTTAAAAADGSFTFAVCPGVPVIVQNPLANTLLNVIETDAGSTGTAILMLSRVYPN